MIENINKKSVKSCYGLNVCVCPNPDDVEIVDPEWCQEAVILGGDEFMRGEPLLWDLHSYKKRDTESFAAHSLPGEPGSRSPPDTRFVGALILDL